MLQKLISTNALSYTLGVGFGTVAGAAIAAILNSPYAAMLAGAVMITVSFVYALRDNEPEQEQEVRA